MDDEKLISAVQMRPCIFDKADKNRFNRDLIAAAWQNIAKEVGGDGEFISVITCLNTKNTQTPFRTPNFRSSTHNHFSSCLRMRARECMKGW